MATQTHFYSVSESAQLIGISQAAVRQLIASGEIKSFKFHSEVLCSARDVTRVANRLQKMKAGVKDGKPKRTVSAKGPQSRSVKFTEGFSLTRPHLLGSLKQDSAGNYTEERPIKKR